MFLLPSPTAHSEADLLAEFYHRCKLEKIEVRMEVHVPSTLHRSKRMRADAAVVRNNRIVAFVEGKTPGGKVGGNTRQKHAYRSIEQQYGVPVYWLNQFAQIDDLVQRFK